MSAPADLAPDLRRILGIQAVRALLYGFGSKWWRSPVGWALMTSTTGLALSLLLISAAYIWEDYPHRAGISLAAFGVVVAGSLCQLGAFLWLRFRGADQRTDATQ